MEPLTIAILGGLTATVGGGALIALAKSSPTVMRFLRQRLAGADLLILGRAGAGKTSFWNFLRHGIFADVYPPMSTIRAQKVRAFTVKRPDDNDLDIKTSEDIPGEWEPDEVMTVISRQRPDLIVVLCSAADDEATPWFRAFCTSLNGLLLDDRPVAKKLKAILVVQSKIDLVSGDALERQEELLRNTLASELTASLQHNAKEIPVARCTFFKSEGGEPRANELVLLMTRLLNSRDSLAVTYNG